MDQEAVHWTGSSCLPLFPEASVLLFEKGAF